MWCKLQLKNEAMPGFKCVITDFDSKINDLDSKKILKTEQEGKCKKYYYRKIRKNKNNTRIIKNDLMMAYILDNELD